MMANLPGFSRICPSHFQSYLIDTNACSAGLPVLIGSAIGVDTTGQSDQGRTLPTSERVEKRHLPPQQPPPPSLCTPPPPPPPPPSSPAAAAAPPPAVATAAESFATAGTIPATNTDMSAHSSVECWNGQCSNMVLAFSTFPYVPSIDHSGLRYSQ